GGATRRILIHGESVYPTRHEHKLHHSAGLLKRISPEKTLLGWHARCRHHHGPPLDPARGEVDREDVRASTTEQQLTATPCYGRKAGSGHLSRSTCCETKRRVRSCMRGIPTRRDTSPSRNRQRRRRASRE